MPSAAAVRFMTSTKPASLAATCSASATLASLPDWMISPRSRSPSGTTELASTNIREPGIDCAVWLTMTGSSSASVPRASSSATM